MTTDEELLEQYARERSESAFGELVTRHLDYVYSDALRVVNGDAPLAQDVTQTVFFDLARQAGKLSCDVALAGWLHRHTCYTAAKAVRTERRRQSREQTAMEMRALDDHTRPEWELVAPYLDESLNELNPKDRDALVLRYLRKQDLRAVGAALSISEDAAQKRVDRALEKLHALLKQRGATLSLAALGTALATQAVTAAPAGLAGSITAAALASAAAGTATTLGVFKSMVSAKLILGAAGVLCFALLLGGLFLSIPPTPPALQFSILGWTNDHSGTTTAIVKVVNNTGRTQNYAYWAQVQTAGGWTEAKNWEAQHPGRMHWIIAHSTNRFGLPAPDEASSWRLKFMHESQPSAFEWKWYAVVRRTGLKRIGLREQPRQNYFFTNEMTE